MPDHGTEKKTVNQEPNEYMEVVETDGISAVPGSPDGDDAGAKKSGNANNDNNRKGEYENTDRHDGKESGSSVLLGAVPHTVYDADSTENIDTAKAVTT